MNINRNKFMGLLMASAVLSLAACGGGSDTPAPAAPVTRSATLAAPAGITPTTGMGTAKITVDNAATYAISGTGTFSGLSGAATVAHIHNAAGVVQALTVTAGTVSGSGTLSVPAGAMLTPAAYAELIAGTLYVNVHTTANPGGEIRGDLK